MNKSAHSTLRGRSMLLAAVVLGLASGAQAARAQDEPDKPSNQTEKSAPPSAPTAAAPQTTDVGGVTVNAPRARPPLGIPPDKKAALDAEAAQDQAWRDYRRSTPPLTDNVNDLSKDFPGLQTYLPK